MMSLFFLGAAALLATLQMRVPHPVLLGAVALLLLVAAGAALPSAGFAAPIASLCFLSAGIAIASIRTPGPQTPFARAGAHALLPLLTWFLLIAALQSEQGAHLGLDPVWSALRALSFVFLGAGLWHLLLLHPRAASGGLLVGSLLLLHGGSAPALPHLQLPLLAADGGGLQLLRAAPDGLLEAFPLLVAWRPPAPVIALLMAMLVAASLVSRRSGASSPWLALRHGAALGALILGVAFVACAWIGVGAPDAAGLQAIHEAAQASAHPDARVLIHPSGPAAGVSVAHVLLHAWPLWVVFVLLFAGTQAPPTFPRDSMLPGSTLLMGAGVLLLVADLQAGWGIVATSAGAALLASGLAAMGIAFATGARRAGAPIALLIGALAPWLVFRLVLG